MRNFAYAALLIGSASAALAQSPAELCSETKMLTDDSEANRAALFACLSSLANAKSPVPAIPTGAIIAFNGECPTNEGWEPFTDGQGKFIIGAGKGILVPSGPHNPSGDLDPRGLTELSLGDEGGDEAHALLPGEMPSHNHAVTASQGVDVHDGLAGAGDSIPFGIDEHFRADAPIGSWGRLEEMIGFRGGNAAHNNMPPFIALNLCEKKR